MQNIKLVKQKECSRRVIIEHVYPEIDEGLFPIKRVVFESVNVQADIYAEGHDSINAFLLYKMTSENNWQKVIMQELGNDRWEGCFIIQEESDYEYSIQAWVNHFETWQKDFSKRVDADQDVAVDMLVGIGYLENLSSQGNVKAAEEIKLVLREVKKASNQNIKNEILLSEKILSLTHFLPEETSVILYEKNLKVHVDRKKALFSSWYELFPRSFGKDGNLGTFKGCEDILPEITRMGFNVLYLPPIHPIAITKRKGKNNALVAAPSDPGCPWAIGGKEGGHKAIHPELGTMADFQKFIKKADSLDLEVAIDLAFQCSPEHPYVKEHPEWFFKRPDGTIQYAENPPKKYEDVYPINFHCEDSSALWEELKSVVIFWIENGIKIFRVDNPHTKPFGFWQWLISEVRKDHPDVLFLAEAFTRPKVMNQLAKIGFHQSYTYFTWRTTKWDLIQYMTELTQTEIREYFRPNFWPNTPDILPYHLQGGGRPAFISRLVLAATLSSNYGIYGPAYELCVKDAFAGKEEYVDSEKYEIKQWNWNSPGHIKDLIGRVNKIRKENPSLQTTWNVKFCEIQNDQLISYYKNTDDLKNIILVIVNLDPFYTQSGMVKLPLEEWNMSNNKPFKVVDLLTRDEYIWKGAWNFIELNPYKIPAHIFQIKQM